MRTKPETITVGELPGFFGDSGISISRHGKRDRFRETDAKKTLLQTVSIGQDFVVDDPSGRVEECARGIMKSSTRFES